MSEDLIEAFYRCCRCARNGGPMPPCVLPCTTLEKLFDKLENTEGQDQADSVPPPIPVSN